MRKLIAAMLVQAALTACAAETDAPTPPDVRALEDTDVLARPAPPALPAQCGGLQEVASTLLGSYQHCERDADCGVVFVDGPCLNGLLCPVALNQGSDLARLEREAAALSYAYQKACTSACPVADCAAPSRTSCDRETKRCKNSYRQN